jgi:equilibrative nucleoside transporter 1/2/3
MPGYSPATVVVFAVSLLNVSVQIWVIIIGQKYSFNLRIVLSFMIQAIVMVLIPIIANIGGKIGYWSWFAILMIFGLISGIGIASVFSLAGGLPPKYMGAVVLGNGITGFVVNVLRAITLELWPVGKS